MLEAGLGDVSRAQAVDPVKGRAIGGPVAVESGEMENVIAAPDELIQAPAVQQIPLDRVVGALQISDRLARRALLQKRRGPVSASDRGPQKMPADETARSRDPDPHIPLTLTNRLRARQPRL